jgi:enamine deaminase RidA (YjgF/YER057c/UK114 family)
MSQVVVHAGLVYLAGQVADRARGASVTDQAAQILEKIERYLEGVGSSKSSLLQVTIWLPDMASYAEFNAVWDRWIDPAHPPARACVQADLANSDWRVELMVVAALQ